MARRGTQSRFYTNFLTNRKKCVVPGGLLFAFNPWNLLENPDNIDKKLPTQQVFQQETTGGERLKMMFTPDDYGNFSPHFKWVMNTTGTGIIAGVFAGGLTYSRECYLDFMENFQASSYSDHLDAKQKLQNKVVAGLIRGSLKWGWRIGLLSGTTSLLTTSIAVYRGTPSILEYLIVGSVAGIMYNLKTGPKAMAKGGALGGVIGSTVGCIVVGYMHFTGTTMEDSRYWRNKWKEDYKKSKLIKLEEQKEKEADS